MSEKREKQKIVCMCRGGNVRSVAAKMILSRYLGHEVLACGLDSNGIETRSFLFEWADAIVVLHDELLDGVPREFQYKVYTLNVGEDVWGNPFAEDLQVKIAAMLNTDPVFNFGRVIDIDKVKRVLRRYNDKIAERLVAATKP